MRHYYFYNLQLSSLAICGTTAFTIYNLQFDKKVAQESAFCSSKEGNFLEIGVARAVFAGF